MCIPPVSFYWIQSMCHCDKFAFLDNLYSKPLHKNSRLWCVKVTEKNLKDIWHLVDSAHFNVEENSLFQQHSQFAHITLGNFDFCTPRIFEENFARVFVIFLKTTLNSEICLPSLESHDFQLFRVSSTGGVALM